MILIIFIILALLVLGQCDLKTTDQDLKLKELAHPEIFKIVEDVNADDYCANSPECYITDENGEILTFNLLPPETVLKWQIHKVTMPDHSAFQNEIMRYAYRLSNNKDFLYTLRAENGTIDPNRRSNIIGANGYYDYGLCQLNYQWHSNFIDSDEFNDWRKQIEYCYEVFKKRPGAFYGYYKRHSQNKHFKF